MNLCPTRPSKPNEYKHFVSGWESAPDDKQPSILVAPLLVEEEREKEKKEDTLQPSSALVEYEANQMFQTQQIRAFPKSV